MMRASSGNLVAGQPVGVAGSVDALVVVAHPARLLGQAGVGSIVAPTMGWSLIWSNSASVSGGGLGEDALAHRDLPDVVQQRRATKADERSRSRPSAWPSATA